jgi:hypothetical protein
MTNLHCGSNISRKAFPFQPGDIEQMIKDLSVKCSPGFSAGSTQNG